MVTKVWQNFYKIQSLHCGRATIAVYDRNGPDIGVVLPSVVKLFQQCPVTRVSWGNDMNGRKQPKWKKSDWKKDDRRTTVSHFPGTFNTEFGFEGKAIIWIMSCWLRKATKVWKPHSHDVYGVAACTYMSSVSGASRRVFPLFIPPTRKCCSYLLQENWDYPEIYRRTT